MDPDDVIALVKDSGSARPRRRRLPDRHQVVVHPAGRHRRRRQAALPGHQRRRVGTRYVQRHSADADHAALPGGGRDHRRVRDPGAPRLHLRARRGGAGAAPAAGRGRRGLRGRLPRHRHQRLGLRPRADRARRRGRLHLRRGDRAAGLAGGPARPAPAAAAVPRGGRPVRLPDGGQQRRIHRQRAADHAQRGRLVPVDGHGEVARLHAVLAVRPRHQPRAVRGAAGHHAARTARVRRRGAGRTLAEVLDTRRLVDAAADRRTPRRATGLRGHGRRRIDAGHQGAADLRRDHLRGARGAPLDRVLRARVVRQVHAVPRGHLLAGQIYERLETGRGHRGGHPEAAGHLRHHLRKVVLRVGRRRGQPDPVVDQVLPRRVRRAPGRRLPVRSARLDADGHRRRWVPDDA